MAQIHIHNHEGAVIENQGHFYNGELPSGEDDCLQALFITDPRHDKTRIEQIKGGLQEQCYSWILEHDHFQQWRNGEHIRLLWIDGDPGKGKTMLLCGIINKLRHATKLAEANTSKLLSFFFCQASDSRINKATAILRGLIFLLVIQHRPLLSHTRKMYSHRGKSLFEDTNAWVALSEIFTAMLQDLSSDGAFLAIDGLDECVEDLPKLLDLIVRTARQYPGVKWIVSSRNDIDIERRLQLDEFGARLTLELEDNAKQVSAAVNTYIEHCLSTLVEIQDDKSLQGSIREKMQDKANGTFLWVSLVAKEIQDVMSWDIEAVLDEFPTDLKNVYRRMVNRIKQLPRKYPELCRQVLSTVVAAYRPLHLQELHVLSSLPINNSQVQNVNKSVAAIVRMCGSFLTIRDNTIYVIHQSAKEFLSQEANHDGFTVGIGGVHTSIFLKSLEIMSRTLRRDMYDLRALGYPIQRVTRPDPDPLAASRYSCLYWADHLYDRSSDLHGSQPVDLQDLAAVDRFLREKFLYWLEALSLCRSVSGGVVSVEKLETLFQGRGDATELVALLRDGHRFMLYHKRVIENYPLQVYVSALVFSPNCSVIRHLFEKEMPNWFTVRPDMGEEWSACLQTFEGHDNWVRWVAASHDSARLASASDDGTVKIWDSSSGWCLHTLKGHTDPVFSVAFSHDSAQLASASGDGTIKIWEASSGECLQTLTGHKDVVRSVTFSHDSMQLASASADCTVRIWNPTNGECLRILVGHRDGVWSVAFSHDSTQLASASDDGTARIWGASGECMQTLKGHLGWVTSVAFSHDSTRLASASDDNTIKIWDTGSSRCLATLEGHTSTVFSATFSHDSTKLASASHDHMIKIWIVSSGECLQTLDGHGRTIYSVIFMHESTRLVSASQDRTIKIWDVSSGKQLRKLDSHGGYVFPVIFSHDAALLATVSTEDIIKIWDARNGKCLQTMAGHTDWIRSIVFSHGSTQLITASRDKTIKIWNVARGECLQTLTGHKDWVEEAIFSHDLTKIASASNDHTVKIWNARDGKCLQILEGHRDAVWSIAFSGDSTHLASASGDGTVRIWEASSGKCLKVLEGHGDLVWRVVYSPDFTRLASSSKDHTVRIWSMSSQECLHTLQGHKDWVVSIAFSLSSTKLASASEDKTVKIWDTRSGECLRTFIIGDSLWRISFDTTGSYLNTEIGTIAIDTTIASNTTQGNLEDPQNAQYQGCGLTHDGAWITYDSENILWLPSEYRPSASAVSGKTIGIGVGSGKVWMCNFSKKVNA